MNYYTPILVKLLASGGYLEGVPLTLCFAGSRGENLGAQGWDVFGKNLKIIGFDADAEACAANNKRNQLGQIVWHEEHVPKALWNSTSTRKLYVSQNPYGTSLLPPDVNTLKRFRSYAEIRQAWEVTTDEGSFNTISVEEISCISLDDFFNQENSGNVPDVLFMDVQGAELEVLRGATETLQRGGLAIMAETMFLPLYEKQGLFSDIDILLRKRHRYSFFDFDWLARGKRYLSPEYLPAHREQLFFACEAYWFRDLLDNKYTTGASDPKQLLKLACIADILKFPGYALEILAHITGVYGRQPQFDYSQIIKNFYVDIAKSS
jgi:FkbM family methyltransferase